MNIDQFQTHIGVRFKNQDLLQQAMTHRSYVNEHNHPGLIDNERLEFLGDAVLSFVAADLLFGRFTDVDEGTLTRLRAALVRTESFAALAQDCGIDATLRMGRGEEANGGRKRQNNLCGAFEAFIGALYLDQGSEAVNAFMVPRLLPLLEQTLNESLDKDARSVLQEWSQAQHNVTPAYRTASESGPDHDKQFTVEVLIGEDVAGVGVGRSKQTAAQAAARAALQRIRQNESATKRG